MKCPFCLEPCGNEHCPYYQEPIKDCEKEVKGLKEENIRLKETIKQLQDYLTKKQ